MSKLEAIMVCLTALVTSCELEKNSEESFPPFSAIENRFAEIRFFGFYS
jgi:hypothetical protein